jgi:hypothetical protein
MPPSDAKAPSAEEILLGRGVLNWDRFERVTDRYGSVTLTTALDSSQDAFDPAAFRHLRGTRGQLVAIVEQTRTSRHIGDLFHGYFPTTPEVGERILLGTGIFHCYQGSAGWEVGLSPTTGPVTPAGDVPGGHAGPHWLDPKALYRAHEQTVRLSFVPAPSANPVRAARPNDA